VVPTVASRSQGFPYRGSNLPNWISIESTCASKLVWTKDEHFRKSVVDVLMPSNFSSFYRRGPDNVTEELVAALSGSKSYEFKALFSVIHAALRARKAAGGGEEMLRLRTYEKLQNLVRVGQVKKTGKKYKGVAKALLLLSESLKECRKNGPSFSRRLPLAPKPL